MLQTVVEAGAQGTHVTFDAKTYTNGFPLNG